jgi:S1-C subfamily serine protease
VTIYAEKTNEEKIESQGSGFMYTNSHIMTNEHVIRGTSEYYIRYKNGEWSKAKFVGSDVDTDIAILKPETVPSYVSVLPMQMKEPTIGEPVVAIGSPSGLEMTLTTGVVSSHSVMMNLESDFGISDSIQTDAALNPGNSGGPLLTRGNNTTVIGINRATLGQNIGYAVSSRMAHKVGKSLIKTNDYRHPYLGIRTSSLNPNSSVAKNVSIDTGLIITDIKREDDELDNLLTRNDEFMPPDVITKVDGIKVQDNEDLASYIALNKEPGDTISLEIYRDGSIITKDVELDARFKYK